MANKPKKDLNAPLTLPNVPQRPLLFLEAWQEKNGDVTKMDMTELSKFLAIPAGVLSEEYTKAYLGELEKLHLTQVHTLLSSTFIIKNLQLDTERTVEKMRKLDEEAKDDNGYRKPAIQKDYKRCEENLKKNETVLRERLEIINDGLEWKPYYESLILHMKKLIADGGPTA